MTQSKKNKKPKKPKKQKKKLTKEQKAAKAKRREEYMTVFIHGKQKQVRRPQMIDGMPVDEFIRNNADPIWLKQNEMWEELDLIYNGKSEVGSEGVSDPEEMLDDTDYPF